MSDENLPAVIGPPDQSVAAPGLFGSDEPDAILERATKIAGTLARVIRDQKLAVRIQSREHVRVEGWTLLGSMLGVFPVCTWTRPLENGWEARVEARTLAGNTVGSAEAMCTRDERTWSGRDEYALRSMAQTRATAKCLRLPLGFVMQLAGYDPTPAEEMPRENGEKPDPKAATRLPLEDSRPKSEAAQIHGAISKKQVGLFRYRVDERARAMNENPEVIKRHVLGKLGVKHTEDLTWRQFDVALKEIEAFDPVLDGVSDDEKGVA